MPAYLVEMPQPPCRTCGRPAKLELRNGMNAVVGHYCQRCGPGALSRFQAEVDARAGQ